MLLGTFRRRGARFRSLLEKRFRVLSFLVVFRENRNRKKEDPDDHESSEPTEFSNDSNIRTKYWAEPTLKE